MPTLQRSFEGKAQILFASPITKLKGGSPNYADLTLFLKWSENKEVAEQCKMGLDA